MVIESFLASISAIIVSIIATSILKSVPGHLQILDHPNERSLHSTPKPRTGGLGIWLGIIIGLAIISLRVGMLPELIWIGGAAFLVGIISFLDDRSHIPVGIRISIHFLSGGLLFMGSYMSLSWWPGYDFNPPTFISTIMCLFLIVWVINLYNFMDGMDGFAGGMAIFGFGTFGLLGHLAGDNYYATVCWIVAASTAGFLVWNFPPARIFMGDTGSSVLGLLVAALSLWADRDGLFPLWLAMLVFMPFVFDATLTLARRTLQGERIWEAHRSHYYQRLVQAGWSHRRTVLWEYGLMLLCSVGALCAFRASMLGQWVVIGMILVACLAGVIGVRHIERRQLSRRTSEISL